MVEASQLRHDSQRSIYKVKRCDWLPARESRWTKKPRTRFRRNSAKDSRAIPSRSRVYNGYPKGVPSSGIEYYLPLFFDKTALVTDYLPIGYAAMRAGGLQPAIEQFLADTTRATPCWRGDRAHPCCHPTTCSRPRTSFFARSNPTPEWNWKPSRSPSPATHLRPRRPLPPLAVERRANDPLHLLRSRNDVQGSRLLLAEGAGRRETSSSISTSTAAAGDGSGLRAVFASPAKPIHARYRPAALGFHLTDPPLAIITENELFAHQARPGANARARSAPPRRACCAISPRSGWRPGGAREHGIAATSGSSR